MDVEKDPVLEGVHNSTNNLSRRCVIASRSTNRKLHFQAQFAILY